MSHQTAATSVSQFVDFYEVLQIPPSAGGMDIVEGLNARLAELADPDTGLSLSTRARESNLVMTAYDVLCKPTTRFPFDVIRLMERGELSLSPTPQDFPSRSIARGRLHLAGRTLQRTLDCLAEAYDSADLEFQRFRCKWHGECSLPEQYDKIKQAQDQLWIFCAHVILQLRFCGRALTVIDSLSDNEWAFGIRDPSIDLVTGDVCDARKTLQTLHVAEEHIHKHFWPQVAEALRIKEGDEIPAYPERLMRILEHIRY